MRPQTLSKTRFKLALECPTKVYYSLDSRYANAKREDDFLQALAVGGHQVGKFAKLMFSSDDPDAVEIDTGDQEDQIRQTAALLERDNVTIFEATIRHDNLLVRVDVLLKRGSRVDLIEVKSKSWDPGEDSLIGKTARANPITPDWEPYVYDVAFQQRVLERAYPRFQIQPWLMLVDKSTTNSVPGLALKFPIKGKERNLVVEVEEGFDVSQLKEPLLIQVDAREAVARAQNLIREKAGGRDTEFDSLIAEAADGIRRGERLGPHVGQPCKSCEFYCTPAQRSEENRSGWAECMETHFKSKVQNAREESIFGFYGQAKTAGHIDARRLWIRDLGESDLRLVPGKANISLTDRHQLQLQELKQGKAEPFLRRDSLRDAMNKWTFPLHFIDFETAKPAIPFHAGHRPYQQILFQFSHHVVSPDGAVRHANECLIFEGVASPSIDVVRRLRDSLKDDAGTVLHWYPHERTVLKAIRAEIEAVAPPDSANLIEFLEQMGLEKDSTGRLFDLGVLVKNQVFLPGTGGSSSMKKFLPAVLRHSAVVRKRYGAPMYGTPAMPSRNFSSKVWFLEKDGVALDPYKLLGPLFGKPGLDDEIARIEAAKGDVVANGAKAMIAYGRLQDPRLSNIERKELREQLLRYCELDTLAMVMVYEALRGWID